ncbi:MAG: hypothetical protein M3154_00980 [Candidatus Eremiobacteraeota bacterium]|nr:hypothetical protein [Candidatus Eremiobacteraeota bacterium]
MNRVVGTLLAVMFAAATIARAQASETPVPSPVRFKPSAVDLLHAAGANLRTLPKRVVRFPSVATPAVAARQEVALKKGTLLDRREGTGCEAHPLSVERASGEVTPRGTITVRGSCFGPRSGGVEMLGAFPDGVVHLTVTSWTDDTVTASIPAISGVPDQAIKIRLSIMNIDLSHSGDRSKPLTSKTVVSEPVSMRFAAARETVIAPVDWVSNASCGNNIGNAFTRDNMDQCSSFRSMDASGAWFGIRNPERIGDHIRPSANATGDDLWQAGLPAGWVFDRIEFTSSSPGTDIAITPTLDSRHVSWHVRWRTEHVVDRYGPREEATYGIVIFATGPAGMAYK